MEKQSIDAEENIKSLMNKKNYFKTLKRDKLKENSFTAEIQLSGYNDLMLTISDLLKVSILALESEPPYVSGSIFNSEINVMTLLEIALQLLPKNEIELLDAIHKIYLNQEIQVDFEK